LELQPYLSGLLMNSMLFAPFTILLYFYSIRCIFFIFFSTIISSLAFGTSKNDYLSQVFSPVIIFVNRNRKLIS